MSSEVEICNVALSNIRSTGINSLNESSLQAQQCKLKYPIVRDTVLTAADWGFSNRVEPLALLVSTAFNWKYAYQYPTDCLFVNRLILNYETFAQGVSNPYDNLVPNTPDLNRGVPYKVVNLGGKKVIASNNPELRIDYRSRVTDTSMFEVAFVQAVSWLLAAEVSIAVVGVESGRALRADALKMYQTFLASATADTMNQRHSEVQDSEFVSVRN